MDVTTATPAEIDAKIAELMRPLVRAEALLENFQATNWRGERRGTDEQIAEARRQIEEARQALAPYDAEFTRRGGWSRFFLVTNNNGHIHRNRWCSTTYISTQFAWLPQLSGKTDADAVADQGEILCSVCFPDAPVGWTTGVSKRTKEEREARATEKAVRDAAKAVKAITNRDGSPLRDEYGIINTERSAEIKLVELISDHMAFGYGENLPLQARIADALAAKRGIEIEDVMAAALAKATKKAARDKRESEKHARALGLIR